MKVASRFMLPVEMLLGWLLFAMGLVGGVGQGTLYRALLERGENLSWALLFCTLGGIQVMIAVTEWRWMRASPELDIMRASTARSVSAGMAVLAWAAVFVWIIMEGLARTSMMVVMIAPITAAFNAWAYAENQKVKYALDPKHPTTRLQFHR
jgi:hypothetical protein